MPPSPPALQPGQLLARGVARHFEALGFSSLLEFTPTRGLRVDVAAIGPKGQIWVVECKSCRADYMSDSKWQGYLEWCDRFFFAVDTDFPQELLPDETGLIIADSFDAEILRDAQETPLAAARRKSLMLKLARAGADRLRRVTDPGPSGLSAV